MEPLIGEEEKKAVVDYMNSGAWLTEFEKTKEFAAMIANYTGAKYAYILANGTVTLTTALWACGLKVGDEVLVPDYTMVATANAAALIGCEVKFVDINRQNLCMDFVKMQEAISSKTKAVMLVTINGRYPDNIEEFASYCRERGIWLIEDAAQSLGSMCDGKHLGTFGDIGSFSFSMPKIITTGQGGALITNNPELAEKIAKLRDFGREKPGADHYLTQGWNFKFTDLQAVIGIEQMKKLPDRVKRKKLIGKLYLELLKDIPQIELVPTNLQNTAPWFYDIFVEDRDKLNGYLKEHNIGSREFYPPLHSEPVYARNTLSYPVATEISQKGLWLPSSVQLSDEQVNYICNTIKSYFLITGSKI
ncbi:MAG: aminotransferase [Burkholderiales bacterium]|jgi:perosamine synthetase|nr:aminotransferase [Burkholderiales bacterium]